MIDLLQLKIDKHRKHLLPFCMPFPLRAPLPFKPPLVPCGT